MIQSALWWEIWWTCISTYFNLAILLQLSQVYAPSRHILKLNPLTIDRALWNSPPVALLRSLRQTNSFLVPSYGFNCWLMCHYTNEQWGVKTVQLVFGVWVQNFKTALNLVSFRRKAAPTQISVENTWTDNNYMTRLLFYFKQKIRVSWYNQSLLFCVFHFPSPQNGFLANHCQ